MFDPYAIMRPNIRSLKPYSSARSEFAGAAEVWLDANENAYGSPAADGLNRYPDPLQTKVKDRLAGMLGVSRDQIFLGNGSDEAIDLLIRIFCKPGEDEIIVFPPTYGMYKVAADIHDVSVNEVPLGNSLELDVGSILRSVTPKTKMIFVCSPNNPTGNLMDRGSIAEIARNFNGIVVVDEAYIHFADAGSMIADVEDHPNIVVLQTFSKAWGMAGVRAGLAAASREIVSTMNKVKPPYNVGSLTQRAVLEALENSEQVHKWTSETIKERQKLADEIKCLPIVREVLPSNANFLLVRFVDAAAVCRSLIEEKIVVRDRSSAGRFEGCVRITIGTAEENIRLLEALERASGITKL